jgi:hypothetical protein
MHLMICLYREDYFCLVKCDILVWQGLQKYAIGSAC